jgi:predicted methyltransferase MtxX (methanogen marker protein 4)
VKYNGKYYSAGTDVPVGVNPVEDKNSEEIKADDFSKKIEKQYNKTVINRMSTAELKDLARENDIDDELTGAELKKSLIAKFGL